MTAILLQMALCGVLGGCNVPTDPARSLRPEPTITTTDACARVTFTIVPDSSSSHVTYTYPDEGCAVGLVVIKYNRMTWNASTRVLTVQLRVLNTSLQPVQLPVRLALPDR